MTKTKAVQVNLIYLIFNSSIFKWTLMFLYEELINRQA